MSEKCAIIEEEEEVAPRVELDSEAAVDVDDGANVLDASRLLSACLRLVLPLVAAPAPSSSRAPTWTVLANTLEVFLSATAAAVA